MVAGAGDCAWNTARQPFLVSNITYNVNSSIAHLKATAVDWQTAIHTYDLEVGSIKANTSDLHARDITKDLTVSIAHKFSPNVKWSKGNLDLELSCADCHTTGSVQFGLVLKTTAGIPQEAYLSLTPQAVSAMANIKFGVSGTLVDDILAKEITPITVPLTPISVGDLFIIGPELSFGIGAKLGDVTASADLTLGAEARLQSPFTQIDLLNPGQSTFRGWMPSISEIAPTVSGQISATAEMYAKVSLNMDASALGKHKILYNINHCSHNRPQVMAGY